MPEQAEKGKVFRALHQRDHAFIIPNPWDAGSARMLTSLGFEALATTSAGYAFSCGQRDNSIGRERMLAHCRTVVEATHLPVSADLENCFADDPAGVAETVRLAAQTGLAGCSVEDMSTNPSQPIYSLDFAAERVRAAAEAARSLGFTFTVTARAENYLVGRKDLDDTIKRLQAFQEAGADVLYAPGLTSKSDIETVVRSVDRPVNVIMGLKGVPFTLAELSKIGVKRISVGSALCRAAYGAFLRAAKEMKEKGTFTFADEAVPFGELTAMF